MGAILGFSPKCSYLQILKSHPKSLSGLDTSHRLSYLAFKTTCNSIHGFTDTLSHFIGCLFILLMFSTLYSSEPETQRQ